MTADLMQYTMVGPPIEDVVRWWKQRAKDQGRAIAQMRKLQEVANGDLLIPLPEMDEDEEPAVANIITQGLDQLAGRMASTTPTIWFPPPRPGIIRSNNLSRDKGRAAMSWWQYNHMAKKLFRRYRHLAGYGYSPVTVMPDIKRGLPVWRWRDPLNTFVLESNDPDDMTPLNAIFSSKQKYGFLREKFPGAMAAIHTGNTEPSYDDEYDILEYHDAEVLLQVVVGQNHDTWDSRGRAPYAELQRLPNKAGVCLVVAPGRITLDRRAGIFDGTIGMYRAQAKSFALEYIAAERGIFADRFLVSRPNEIADFIAGPFDGRSGDVNVVKGGTMEQIGMIDSQAATRMGDRLERNIRVTGGIAPEMGGESQSNVRTGKRGDSIMSAVIDIPVQEQQMLMAESLQNETQRGIAIAKGWFGTRPVSFFLNTGNKFTTGHVTYTANDLFDSDSVVVSYPMAGTDVNSLTILMGQLRGLNMISAQTAMLLHPLIGDAVEEKRLIEMEQIEQAVQQSVLTQMGQGTIGPADGASIALKVGDGMSYIEAVIEVQKEAQARQATIAPQPTEGQATAPEAQPGLAAPGAAGAEQPSAAPPSQGLMNITQSLRMLRTGQRESPDEKGTE